MRHENWRRMHWKVLACNQGCRNSSQCILNTRGLLHWALAWAIWDDTITQQPWTLFQLCLAGAVFPFLDSFALTRLPSQSEIGSIRVTTSKNFGIAGFFPSTVWFGFIMHSKVVLPPRSATPLDLEHLACLRGIRCGWLVKATGESAPDKKPKPSVNMCEHVGIMWNHVAWLNHHNRVLVGCFFHKKVRCFCFFFLVYYALLLTVSDRLFFAGHGLRWWFLASFHESLRYVPNVAYEIQLRNELPLKGVIIGDSEAMALEVVRIIWKE